MPTDRDALLAQLASLADRNENLATELLAIEAGTAIAVSEAADTRTRLADPERWQALAARREALLSLIGTTREQWTATRAALDALDAD